MIPKNHDMRFEVSTRCNYNCIICPHDTMNRAKETMSLELFKQLFDKVFQETQQYNTITFSGMGEALLDETLPEKIAYAKKCKSDLNILILTNGSKLTLEKFQQLSALGVTSFRVSFYGVDATSYSTVHGLQKNNMFERVRDALVDISKIKTKTELLLTYNVVDKNDEKTTQEWIDFWKDKVDLIEVWRPHNWATSKDYRSIQEEKLTTCGRPFKGPLQIQVDGTINMCCFDFDGQLLLGDLKTQTLEEIFSSPMFEKIKACHQSGNYEDSGLICENCDQRNVDKSDVMVYNTRFDPNERVHMTSTSYEKID